MKKIIFFILFVASISLKGQTVQWEVLNAGIAMGMMENSKKEVVKEQPYLTFGASLKASLDDDGVYIGLDLTFSGWNRYYLDNWTSHQFIFSTLMTLDYVTGSYKKIEPFVGLGGGITYIDSNAKSYYVEDSKNTRITISPRCGVKYRNLQLTAQYNYLGSNSFFNLKLGYCLTFSK